MFFFAVTPLIDGLFYTIKVEVVHYVDIDLHFSWRCSVDGVAYCLVGIVLLLMAGSIRLIDFLAARDRLLGFSPETCTSIYTTLSVSKLDNCNEKHSDKLYYSPATEAESS